MGILVLWYMHSEQETTDVLAGLMDSSKAFNHIDHNVLVTILAEDRLCVWFNGVR